MSDTSRAPSSNAQTTSTSTSSSTEPPQHIRLSGSWSGEERYAVVNAQQHQSAQPPPILATLTKVSLQFTAAGQIEGSGLRRELNNNNTTTTTNINSGSSIWSDSSSSSSSSSSNNEEVQFSLSGKYGSVSSESEINFTIETEEPSITRVCSGVLTYNSANTGSASASTSGKSSNAVITGTYSTGYGKKVSVTLRRQPLFEAHLRTIDANNIDYNQLSGEWGGLSRNNAYQQTTTIWTHTMLTFAMQPQVVGKVVTGPTGVVTGQGFSLWVRCA